MPNLPLQADAWSLCTLGLARPTTTDYASTFDILCHCTLRFRRLWQQDRREC